MRRIRISEDLFSRSERAGDPCEEDRLSGEVVIYDRSGQDFHHARGGKT